MTSTKSVDRLVVRFVVDNCIEWMTKLPPGFTHEMRQHLAEQEPPVDPLTGVPFLDLEHYCCGAHGFSALIETQLEGSPPHLTLFDTGPDSRAIARNLDSLQIPIERVERVILSHWHADHSGGMLTFLRLRAAAQVKQPESERTPCAVDLHPDRPIARGISYLDKILGRLPDDPSFQQIEAEGGVVEKHGEGHAVSGDTVWVSGEIPRVTPWECGISGGLRWVGSEGVQGKGGEWIKDEEIMDERYAAIDVAGKGLVIFSACSHAGIVNVVRDAISKFSRPVYMIIGGLHLAGPELTERIPPTVEFLTEKMRPAPAYVLPMHCSGFAAKVALEAALGEGCVPAGVGMKVEVQGDRDAEKMIMLPTIS
ncbi:beta-lactamase-like protein [Sparassis latifolia]